MKILKYSIKNIKYFITQLRNQEMKATAKLIAICILMGLFITLNIIPFSFGITLPTLTGKFITGTQVYHLVDNARNEVHTSNPQDKRELVLQVWYPAEKDTTKPKAMYFQKEALPIIKSDLEALGKQKGLDISSSGFDYLSAISTNSLVSVPVTISQLNYPVVIFTPGFGMPVSFYTSILEELASYGYIVVAINHTYVTNPTILSDGRVIKQSPLPDKSNEVDIWVKDILFVITELAKLNQHDPRGLLTNKLNMEQIGIIGHSFGGSTALKVSAVDPRIKAGIDIEGKVYGEVKEYTLTKPFMFIQAYPEQSQEKVLEEHKKLQQLCEKATVDSYYALVKNAEHATFSDFFLINAPWYHSKYQNSAKGIELTRSLVLRFFDTYLKGINKMFVANREEISSHCFKYILSI
jgi:dienelactone hydrolase